MNIPAQMQPVYEEIAGMIEEYCEKYMNEEYRVLCLRLLEKLCRKRPSPLLKGRRRRINPSNFPMSYRRILTLGCFTHSGIAGTC